MRSYGYVNKQQLAMRQLQLATTIGGSNSNKYRIENRCKWGSVKNARLSKLFLAKISGRLTDKKKRKNEMGWGGENWTGLVGGERVSTCNRLSIHMGKRRAAVSRLPSPAATAISTATAAASTATATAATAATFWQLLQELQLYFTFRPANISNNISNNISTKCQTR